MSKGWAKVKTAAKYAGVSVRTFRSLLSRGLRHSRLDSGTILVNYDWIDEFLSKYEVRDIENRSRELNRIVNESVRGLAA